MLINLFIKDFGIIEQTEINFTEGLNVLSGETGAGKSIVVDAIKILVGGRALDEYIRSGCDLCFVQGTFSLDNSLGVVQLLSDNGFYLEDEQLIILSREIKRNGRNFCRINGQMVTLALLKDVGSKLIDLQGQNEQQLLFNPDIQLFLLDAYGGKSLTDCRDRVSKLYSQWLEIKNNLEDFNKKNLDLAKRQDLISYQINEIDMAALRTGEEEELHTEKNRLSNKEKISQLLSECYQYIYQGVGIDSLYSALALTGRGMKSLDRLKEMDPAFTVPSELVAGALYQLEEACREISLEIERLDFYPMTLDTVEDRLALIQKLKKKYGSSIEEILAYGDRIKD
ncbi:MAG: AAA family ATPase, partial [Peptococcaceae bacterium]|nr:AAA family ATPase [Peptococcaceae bacterium]